MSNLKFSGLKPVKIDEKSWINSSDFDLDSELYDESEIGGIDMEKNGSVDKRFFKQTTGSSIINSSKHLS